MAHSNNIISSIKLPNGSTYEIHDANAIHDVSELGLSAALVFKGTKATVSDLPTTGNKVGDVWHVTADDYEYVWTDANAWEELGAIYDAASSSHKHNVTVSGTNEASSVTGTVNVPTVSATHKYLTGSVSTPEFEVTKEWSHVTEITSASQDVTKKKLKATASNIAVGPTGTAEAITSITPTTTTVIDTDTNFYPETTPSPTSKMVTSTASKVSVEAQSIPNVTGNTEVTASKITAFPVTATKLDDGISQVLCNAVVTNGVLSFGISSVMDVAASEITENKSVTATNTTLGTAISTSKVTANDVTVATGTLAADGKGASVVTSSTNTTGIGMDLVSATVLTGLGDPTKTTVPTGVKVTAQPTITLAEGTTGFEVVTNVGDISIDSTLADDVEVITDITPKDQTVTLNTSGTQTTGAIKYAETVSVGSTTASISGTAAAQKWSGSASTGTPTNVSEPT